MNIDTEGWPTTRRHFRSLSEAFPDERAYAVEIPEPRGVFRKIGGAALVLMVVALVAGVVA
jgi:hypothetical protein